jgi:hypothetical protein
MAAIVTLIIEKTMKKIFKKKIIPDLPTLIFSRYETGTTGIFFTPYQHCSDLWPLKVKRDRIL